MNKQIVVQRQNSNSFRILFVMSVYLIGRCVEQTDVKKIAQNFSPSCATWFHKFQVQMK